MTPERWSRLLLRLYPRRFRARYGEEMVEFHRERWRDARAAGPAAVAAACLGVLRDVAATAPREHLAALAARRAMTSRPHPASDPAPHPVRETPVLDIVRQDVRYALLGMRRRPAFTAVVVATLALGIGATTAIFSVVNAILVRPLPFAQPERIVELSHVESYGTVSEPEFRDYRRDMKAFERLAAFAPSEANLTGTDVPERIQVARVSDQFFAVTGVRPALGRTFSPDEEVRGGPMVVMLSDGLWRRRFGADPTIVGRTVTVNDVPRTVVGVLPRHLDYPTATTALYTPLRLKYDSLWTRNNHYLRVVGRLAPGATVASASTEANALDRRWMTDYPETYAADKPLTATLVPIRDAIIGPTRPYLIALFGAVGFVLLIACVNVANLLLTRGESQRKELAIRTALGASGGRLAQQALTESALLALAGGALGLLLAWGGGRALLAMAPSSIPRLDAVTIDLPVLAFTLVVALATGMLFGLAPALGAARGITADTLRQGGRTSSTGGARRTRSLLVVTEVALAVVMLSGAGLMLRSLAKLRAIDLGFEPAGVLAVRVTRPAKDYDDVRTVAYARELANRAAALPGVSASAVGGWVPVAGEGDGGSSWSIMLDGKVLKNISESPAVTPAQVTPGFFRVMRQRLVRGRDFTDADDASAPAVTVVNETMARLLWPGRDAVGHTVKMFSDDAPWATVVGVVADVRAGGFLEEVPPIMYVPLAQAGKSAYYTPRSLSLVLRTAGDPVALAPAARAIVASLERNAPISSVRTMDDVVAASIASRRFSTVLLGAFATLALALAGLGIYGVIAYAVTQRTYELGLRMALGARGGAVVRLVIGQGLRMTLVGLALGLVGALGVGRAARSLLVGVTPLDWPTLVAVAVVLAGVALLASALPARRATLVSPTQALRNG